MDIRQDPKLEYFLNQKERKQSTIHKYIRDIGYFAETVGKTPTELIQEARYEQKNFDWMDERQLPHYFDKFIEYINKKGFTEYSQKMMIISVKAFYHCFEIATPKKGVTGVPKSYYLMYEDLPQYEDIRKLISLSNIQYTALFSHMASSGMNYSDATSISVEELLKAVNFYFRIIKNEIRVHTLDDLYQLQEKSEVIIPAWRMWRFKTSNQHITFSSPESLNNILDYFEENPPADLNVPVFRSSRSQKILGYESVRHYLGEMNEKLGWDDKKVGTFKYITSKSFRTFFLNELEDEDLNYRTIRLMMGHKMPGVDQNYSKKKAAKFLKTYKKGLHRLTFAEKPVLIQGDNDEEIKAMKEELNKRAEADKEKDEIIKQLRADVNRALGVKRMEDDLKNNQK